MKTISIKQVNPTCYLVSNSFTYLAQVTILRESIRDWQIFSDDGLIGRCCSLKRAIEVLSTYDEDLERFLNIPTKTYE